MKKIFLFVLCLCVAFAAFPVFAATEVSEFSINVTEPVPGEKADYNVILPEDAPYMVTNVKWIGVFDANKVYRSDYDYTIQFTVEIKEDFDGYIVKNDDTVKVNGSEARLYSISEDKRQAVVSKLFILTKEIEHPFIPDHEEELQEEGINEEDIIYPPDYFPADENKDSVKDREKENEIKFTDVADSAYYSDAVKWAVSKNITQGTSASTFSPDRICTRAEIITFLWRAMGSPELNNPNPYTDVNIDDYYYYAALWAYKNGMVKDKEFNGSVPCTRSSTVMYLWMNVGSPLAETNSQFTDIPSESEYYNAVMWAFKSGVTAGTSQSTFSPDEICTRGQIVTFLNRAMK